MQQLVKKLHFIDGKGYKAYKNIQGSYAHDLGMLYVDYVQGDPFASPSRIRCIIEPAHSRLQPSWFQQPWRRIALEDYITRVISSAIRNLGRTSKGSGKSGLWAIDCPGQEVLERTTVRVTPEHGLDIRLSIGLPAAGRRILGKLAADMFTQQLNRILEQSLNALHHNHAAGLERHLHCSDIQQTIRDYIRDHQLTAFVANGSLLPRQSGISDLPLDAKQIVRFKSPDSMKITIPVPHMGQISGMAIKQGITLIVGGGYHGKSTLLKALEKGVYNHIPGDGREYVITEHTAVKIRAEDGRSITKVNISAFINHLPFQQSTTTFSTDNASGSTSQAANIIEALEMGTDTLLIDEDTSATNFMIRDARMQKLVSKHKEPITPFIDKIKSLHQQHGVSTILVLGGSGDYLDVADQVILMDTYEPVDVTAEAKRIVEQTGQTRTYEGGVDFGQIDGRFIQWHLLDPIKKQRDKADAKGLHTVQFGETFIDLSYVEQLIDPSQTRCIANMLLFLAKLKRMNKALTLKNSIQMLYDEIHSNGLEHISPYKGKHPGDMAMPRPMELAAAINRLRTLRIKAE